MFILSMAFKAKSNSFVRLPIYDFLLVFNNNICHNVTPFGSEICVTAKVTFPRPLNVNFIVRLPFPHI